MRLTVRPRCCCTSLRCGIQYICITTLVLLKLQVCNTGAVVTAVSCTTLRQVREQSSPGFLSERYLPYDCAVFRLRHPRGGHENFRVF
jgi:hypothetical protein